MLRTKVDPQPSLFEALLLEEFRRMPPGLAAVDRLLDDPVFFEPFVPFFHPTDGRPSIPIETYLRLMYLRFRYRLGFETLCGEVTDSLSWRRFCRIGPYDAVPNPSTLMKITTRCGEQAVAGLNAALLEKADAAKLIRLDKVRPVGGVDEGFEALYRAHYQALARLAYLLTQSVEAADDLVQDVFARVLPRWHRLDDPVPYLRRSVVNAANSWHRRRRLESRTPAPAEISSALQADELFVVLARLSSRERAAVVLAYYEDMSDAEVAAVLGCRPGTVPSLVHRAFERMRTAMTDRRSEPEPSSGEGGAP